MKVAIIGCGSIAAVHAQCIQLLSYEFIAFADIKKERADQFALQYHGRAYESYHDMLEKEEIDVVHICTPHYLHIPIALEVLAHGCHVFMEKPPAISLEQFRRLEEFQTSKYIGFCFQNRFNESIVYVKNLIESGVCGQIKGARAVLTWNRPLSYYEESDWRGKVDTEGGGVLINQAIHTLDLLVYLLGKPCGVDATMSNHHLKDKIEVEDTIEAFINFEKDRKACFYGTTSYVENQPPLLEISCENCVLRIEDMNVTYSNRNGLIESHAFEKRTLLGKNYWGSGHLDCISSFYSSIQQGTPFPIDLQSVKDTVLLLFGIYESARMGQLIQLKEDDYVSRS